MTDAEREAQEADLALAKAQLLAAVRRINEGVTELLGIFAVIKGELDTAAARGRMLIDEFYQSFPEFREP